ncbi:MAG: MOSC domain-containing protein [Saprospiraceae bacterium]|nr:MOSC domain-containing protein [Saprospiraceae bacterium]
MVKSIKELEATLTRTGRLEWIGLRPAPRAAVVPTESVAVKVGTGLEGDHYHKNGGNRQVTLVQAEYLPVVGQLLGQGAVDPADLRRNLVVSGINLYALAGRQFRIGGEVVLEITGECHPCTRMEENLGEGGYQAMRSHGGMTAKVVQGGTIRMGDPVELLSTKA